MPREHAGMNFMRGDLLTQVEKENMERALWFWYFTQILHESCVISEQKRHEIEKRINL